MATSLIFRIHRPMMLIFLGMATMKTSAKDSALKTEVTCESGWVMAMQSCYYWADQEVTWSEAQQECHSRGSELLVISTVTEQAMVDHQTRLQATDGWWLGLRYDRDKKAFLWLDGSAAQGIKWHREPDNSDGQDCVTVSDSAMFADDACTRQYAYICKVNKTAAQNCPSQTDAMQWAFLYGACYWISDPADVSKLLSWSDARAACQTLKPNGVPMDLVAFNLQDELLFFQTELPQRSGTGVSIPWWTGLSDVTTEGRYLWSDSSYWNASLTPWDVAPNNDRTQSCGLMSAGAVVDDVKCSLRAKYVCETSALKQSLYVGCPDKWTRGGQSCYQLAANRGFSWLEARHYCQVGGGDLLKVDSPTEKYWLDHLRLGAVGYWTGLNDRDQEGAWRWADGDPYDPNLVQWNREPNNNMGSEDCALISRDGILNDMSCTARAGFICEYYAGSSDQCLAGWVHYPSKGCYFISSTNGSNLLMWYEVQQRCLDLVQAHSRDMQAFYLAIDTQDEATWLTGQLQQQPKSSLAWWTGLTDAAVEGVWLWATSVSNPPNPAVLKWDGEPNNANGNEDCAVMYEGGRYNDLDCAAPAYFICEKASFSCPIRYQPLLLIVGLLTVGILQNLILSRP